MILHCFTLDQDLACVHCCCSSSKNHGGYNVLHPLAHHEGESAAVGQSTCPATQAFSTCLCCSDGSGKLWLDKRSFYRAKCKCHVLLGVVLGQHMFSLTTSIKKLRLSYVDPKQLQATHDTYTLPCRLLVGLSFGSSVRSRYLQLLICKTPRQVSKLFGSHILKPNLINLL